MGSLTKLLDTTKIETRLFINNEFVDSVSGKTFDTIDPATEQVICSVQEAGAADVDKAVSMVNVCCVNRVDQIAWCKLSVQIIQQYEDTGSSVAYIDIGSLIICSLIALANSFHLSLSIESYRCQLPRRHSPSGLLGALWMEVVAVT